MYYLNKKSAHSSSKVDTGSHVFILFKISLPWKRPEVFYRSVMSKTEKYFNTLTS